MTIIRQSLNKGKMLRLALAACTAFALNSSFQAHADDQKILLTSYRVGPFAPNGVPIANGVIDYIAMINERDGGIEDTLLDVQECETQYEPARGVECYERYKALNGGTLPGLLPLDGGLAYSLYDRANKDKIPIITPGYGRLEGAAGAYFPYEFPIIGNDWEQTSALLQFIAEREGGHDQLKGKKIGLVYLDSAYGKTPFPVLDDMAKRYGFEWTGYPVAGSAMVEQSSIWLQIRRAKPDYVLVWGWGVMTPTAIKEALKINFPLDRLIGNWWSAAEPDVIPVGAAAKGYVGATFRLPGTEFPVYEDLETHVYGKDKAKGSEQERGSILYNQGLFFGMLQVEAIRAAKEKFGSDTVTGEQVRWGLEHLKLDDDRLKALGFEGLIAPLSLSCTDHAGGGKIKLIQWDGENWKSISDWIGGQSDVSKPLLEASAEKLATEMGRQPRDCAE